MKNPAIDTTETRAISDALQSAADQHVLLTAKGGGISFAGKLFTFASRLVITFVLARALGAGQYGLYNLALTALTVAGGLAVFGLDSALVRYIAVYARRRDEAGLWGTLQLGLGISMLLSILIAVGLFVLAQPIAERIFEAPRLAPLLQTASLVVPLLALSNIAAAATQGFKKMQYTTIARDIAQPLIRLALVAALIIPGLNAGRALMVYCVAVAISAVMLLFFLNKMFALNRPMHAARRDTRDILQFSIPVFLSDLMTTFRENVQTLLLGALNTVASVGVFAVANQVNMVGSMFQSAIATASRPIISELYDQGAHAEMERMYQTTTKWTVAVNLPLFMTLVLFPAPILSIFGKSFVAGSTALVLLACAIMADISTGMCGIILDMTGHTRLKLVNAIVRLVLSLGLSILLIPRWGVVGAALAVLLVVSTINVLRLLQVFFLFRLLPYDRSFIKTLIAGLATLAIVLALGYVLPASAASSRIMVQIGTLFVVYVGITLTLGLSQDDRVVLARIRRGVGRKFIKR